MSCVSRKEFSCVDSVMGFANEINHGRDSAVMWTQAQGLHILFLLQHAGISVTCDKLCIVIRTYLSSVVT